MNKEIYEQHVKTLDLFRPSTEEMSRLQEHESRVLFEVLPPVGISEGRQSRVSILEYRVGDQSDRVLWKRMGAGKGLTMEEASDFESRLRPYRRELLNAGWNVPEIFYTAIVPIEGEHQIFSYERLVGRGDGDKMLANPEEPNFRKWHLLRRTAETLAGYRSLPREKVADKEVSRLPHGLDLKLANVVLDDIGTLWFVDLFGPKDLEGSTWRSYSKKLDSLAPDKLFAVCATREGMLLRMYRLAEKVWSAAGTIDPERLRSEFIQLLASLSLPDSEISFIADEIRADFPWLNELYEEKKV